MFLIYYPFVYLFLMISKLKYYMLMIAKGFHNHLAGNSTSTLINFATASAHLTATVLSLLLLKCFNLFFRNVISLLVASKSIILNCSISLALFKIFFGC